MQSPQKKARESSTKEVVASLVTLQPAPVTSISNQKPRTTLPPLIIRVVVWYTFYLKHAFLNINTYSEHYFSSKLIQIGTWNKNKISDTYGAIMYEQISKSGIPKMLHLETWH